MGRSTASRTRASTADLSFAGQEVGASQFTFLIAGGQITGNGGYNLTTRSTSTSRRRQPGSISINVQALKKSPLLLHGQLALNAQGFGHGRRRLIAQAAVHLTNLDHRKPGRRPRVHRPEVDLTAHTAGGSLLADYERASQRRKR